MIVQNSSSRSGGISVSVRVLARIVITTALLSLGPLAAAQKITTAVLPDAKVGAVYSVQLTGQGGKLPYTWYSASSLPMGLSLAQSGWLSGIPQTPGAFTLSLRLVTANNKTTSKTLTMMIAPSIPLAITTLAIPNGIVGQPYYFKIEVIGGTTPYRCEPDAANNLAEFGLELDVDCFIFGVPTKAGEVHF